MPSRGVSHKGRILFFNMAHSLENCTKIQTFIQTFDLRLSHNKIEVNGECQNFDRTKNENLQHVEKEVKKIADTEKSICNLNKSMREICFIKSRIRRSILHEELYLQDLFLQHLR